MKSDSSSSSSNPPVFAVGSTELLLTDDVPELTVRDINKATRSFSDARLIGREHNGATVYRAVLPGGTADAAKRLGKPPSGSWGASEDAFLRQQVSVLSMLRHDNLVRLLGYTIDADHRVLLFELPSMGTLHDVLHDMTLDPPELVNWAPPLLLRRGVERCIDPKLGTQYPPAEALKLGRIALQCLHHDPRSRPSMGAVTQMISGIVGN